MRTPYKVGILVLRVYVVGTLVCLGLYAREEIRQNVQPTGMVIVGGNVLQMVLALFGIRILVLASEDDSRDPYPTLPVGVRILVLASRAGYTELGWLRRTVRLLLDAYVLSVVIATAFGFSLWYPCNYIRSGAECATMITPLYIPFMIFGLIALIASVAVLMFVGRLLRAREQPRETDPATPEVTVVVDKN